MKNNSGFTLIELLVVVAIIGVLTSLVVVNFNAARARARDVQRKSDLDQVKKALRMYYNDHGKEGYPGNETDGRIKALCGGTTTTSFEWGSSFKCGEMVYMRALPEDPKQGSSYSYNQADSGQDFCLWGELENAADKDIEESQGRCSDCTVGDDDYVICAD